MSFQNYKSLLEDLNTELGTKTFTANLVTICIRNIQENSEIRTLAKDFWKIKDSIYCINEKIKDINQMIKNNIY